MNTTINLSNKFWKTSKGPSTFSCNGKAWGVINSDGKALAKNGNPSVWDKKKIVEESIAPYADGFKGHEWIEIFDSATEVKKNEHFSETLKRTKESQKAKK